MTGIEMVMEVYHMVNVPAVQALISPGKVWQHNRPLNSPNPDVIVSIPIFDGNSRGLEYIDVNVHTPNLKGFYPIPGQKEDFTFPDLALQKQVVDTILPLLVSGSGYSLIAAIPGVPIRDNDGHWYTNIRLTFDSVDTGDSHVVTLHQYSSTINTYGGAVVTEAPVWTGTASRRRIVAEQNLTVINGRYEMNMACDWMVSAIDVTPQKNMYLSAPDGKYTIQGIRPDNGMWALSCVRQDAPN